MMIIQHVFPGESYVCATYEVFEELGEEKERHVSAASRYRSLQTAALGKGPLLHCFG